MCDRVLSVDKAVPYYRLCCNLWCVLILSRSTVVLMWKFNSLDTWAVPFLEIPVTFISFQNFSGDRLKSSTVSDWLKADAIGSKLPWQSGCLTWRCRMARTQTSWSLRRATFFLCSERNETNDMLFYYEKLHPFKRMLSLRESKGLELWQNATHSHPRKRCKALWEHKAVGSGNLNRSFLWFLVVL